MCIGSSRVLLILPLIFLQKQTKLSIKFANPKFYTRALKWPKSLVILTPCQNKTSSLYANAKFSAALGSQFSAHDLSWSFSWKFESPWPLLCYDNFCFKTRNSHLLTNNSCQKHCFFLNRFRSGVLYGAFIQRNTYNLCEAKYHCLTCL